MTNRDTFYTTTYKDLFIHSCYDRDLKREVVTWQDEEFNVHPAKSWRAAQLAITKHLKEKKQ